MIVFVNLINNISNDISIINKKSQYYIDYINIIAIGIILIVNIFYFLLYSFNFYYKNEIYVNTNIKKTLILNSIALIFVIITVYQVNYSYFVDFYNYIFNIIPNKKTNLKSTEIPIATPIVTPDPIPTKSSK
jgi:Trk-type K+ transport system membrane component